MSFESIYTHFKQTTMFSHRRQQESMLMTNVRSGSPGPKGDLGDKGAMGPPGERGVPGAKGDRGGSGKDGSKGDRVRIN